MTIDASTSVAAEITGSSASAQLGEESISLRLAQKDGGER
jgi:hypothetical protein